MAWMYHNTQDAVSEFAKKYNCDLALAEDYLKVVRGIRNQQPFYVTDENGEETGEDVALEDTLELYRHPLERHTGRKGATGIEKLNYREQDLARKTAGDLHDLWACCSWKAAPPLKNWQSCLRAALPAVQNEPIGKRWTS